MTTRITIDGGNVLTPAEVASALKVDVKTINRWANAGRLEYFRTPGGHRRYYEADVLAIRRGSLNGQFGGAK